MRVRISFLQWWRRDRRNGLSGLIVNATVKDALSGYNGLADFYGALDEEVAVLLADAAGRADVNDGPGP